MDILIADDQPTARRQVEMLLGALGHNVISVGNGAMALKKLLSPDAPRIAIIDWEMPSLDGIALCRQLRARQKDTYTYVIFLTGRDSTADRLLGLQAGADDHVSKPFNVNDIHARIVRGAHALAKMGYGPDAHRMAVGS